MADSLTGLVASYLDLRWHLDPVAATAAGLTEHDGRLGRFSPDDVRQYLVALKALAGALEALTVDSLDDEIDRTALLNHIRVAIHRFTRERPHVTNPGFALSHVLEGLYLLLTRVDRPREHRARSAAARLAEIPGFLAVAEETLDDCPRVFVETALGVAAGARDLIAEVGQQLRPDGDDGFDRAREQALAALISFERYLAGGLPGSATADFAVGEDAFNFRLHFDHALRDTAPELWRYGLRLVEETERELTELARQLDPGTPWPDLAERLRENFPPAEGLVAAYAAEMERARRFVVERGLVTVPEGPLSVVETPAFLRPLMPFAAYQPPGVFSSDRRGTFYVTTPGQDLDSAAAARRLRDHCVYELAATALHEGYPGHHLQFLSAQAQPRLVRKLVDTPLTVEGWALYCEELMVEEGFYRAEERFFQQVHLLWRAVRIVLDVGLHTRGMTFEQAVDLLVTRVHLERANAEAEVRRYCAYPAYQLSYAVGRREIKALRESFRTARGADYSLRRFHDAILPYGGLPVSLMRWGMGL